MGKIKRARQKAHNAAVGSNGGADNSHGKDSGSQLQTDQVLPEPRVPEIDSNLFEGLDLSKYNIKSQLPDFDTQSAITSRSLKGLKLKKKEKQKLRHDLWLQKLSAIDVAKKKAKDKKKKEQTVVVGDIGALGDALPTLDLLLKTSTNSPHSEESKKPRGIQKEKKRKKQMMEDMSVFQKVIKHPAFNQSPARTIVEHLQNRQKQEDMDT